MTDRQFLSDAARGYYRRVKAQRAAINSNLFAAMDRAGTRLYGDRAGTPEYARRYMHEKRHKLLQSGDCNCLTIHMV